MSFAALPTFDGASSLVNPVEQIVYQLKGLLHIDWLHVRAAVGFRNRTLKIRGEQRVPEDVVGSPGVSPLKTIPFKESPEFLKPDIARARSALVQERLTFGHPTPAPIIRL